MNSLNTGYGGSGSPKGSVNRRDHLGKNDEDYILVPKEELDYLRREVEKLKKNPFGDTRENKSLLDSMEGLSSSINHLINIFETASDDIVRDYKDQSLSARMEKIMEQNEKLAKGMITIAELLKELKAYREEQSLIKSSVDELSMKIDSLGALGSSGSLSSSPQSITPQAPTTTPVVNNVSSSLNSVNNNPVVSVSQRVGDGVISPADLSNNAAQGSLQGLNSGDQAVKKDDSLSFPEGLEDIPPPPEN